MYSQTASSTFVPLLTRMFFKTGSFPHDCDVRHFKNPSTFDARDYPSRTTIQFRFLWRWLEIGDTSDPVHAPEFSSVHSSQQFRRSPLPDSLPAEGKALHFEGGAELN
jgi:hypothetical protein